MSFFSNLFGGSSSASGPTSTEQEKQSQVSNEEVANTSEKDTVTIRYGTQMPIDIIYSYIERDYEQQGYSDALCNADTSFRDSKKEIIRNGLKRLFEQVALRYKSDLRDIEVNISTFEQQGMIATAASLKARRETYTEHLQKLEVMEKALDNGEKQMLSMIDSYDRGFLRGLAAKADTLLRAENWK